MSSTGFFTEQGIYDTIFLRWWAMVAWIRGKPSTDGKSSVWILTMSIRKCLHRWVTWLNKGDISIQRSLSLSHYNVIFLTQTIIMLSFSPKQFFGFFCLRSPPILENRILPSLLTVWTLDFKVTPSHGPRVRMACKWCKQVIVESLLYSSITTALRSYLNVSYS